MRKDFQQHDKYASTHIQNTKAVEILKKHQIKLSDKEFYELCKQFSFNNSYSDLDYIKFLKYFNSKNVKSNSTSSSSSSNHQHQHKENSSSLKAINGLKKASTSNKNTSETAPKWRDLNPTLRKIIFKLREAVSCFPVLYFIMRLYSVFIKSIFAFLVLQSMSRIDEFGKIFLLIAIIK